MLKELDDGLQGVLEVNLKYSTELQDESERNVTPVL